MRRVNWNLAVLNLINREIAPKGALQSWAATRRQVFIRESPTFRITLLRKTWVQKTENKPWQYRSKRSVSILTELTLHISGRRCRSTPPIHVPSTWPGATSCVSGLIVKKKLSSRITHNPPPKTARSETETWTVWKGSVSMGGGDVASLNQLTGKNSPGRIDCCSPSLLLFYRCCLQLIWKAFWLCGCYFYILQFMHFSL